MIYVLLYSFIVSCIFGGAALIEHIMNKKFPIGKFKEE